MFYLVLLYFLLKLTFIKYYWQFSATIVLCFGTRRQVVFKMFNIWSVRRSSSKNLTQIVHLNGKIFFLLTKGLLIKVSLVRRSQSDIFSSRESYVFRHVSASTCEMFIVWGVPKMLVEKRILFDTNRSFEWWNTLTFAN